MSTGTFFASLRPRGERAGTALFAVSVRSTARVGRTTDTLRYLYAASPLQPLLQFYPEHRVMASRSAIRNCQVGVRSEAEAPSWLGLYHVRSGHRQRSKLFGTGAKRRCQAANTPMFDGGPTEGLHSPLRSRGTSRAMDSGHQNRLRSLARQADSGSLQIVVPFTPPALTTAYNLKLCH